MVTQIYTEGEESDLECPVLVATAGALVGCHTAKSLYQVDPGSLLANIERLLVGTPSLRQAGNIEDAWSAIA